MSKIKNKKLNFSIRRGMTLIEVMASIAIIGIMSAISIVSFSASKRSAELETAAEEVVAVLREAQNYSLTGKEIEQNCSNYRVNLTTASGNYLLRTMNGAVPCAGISSTYSLKNGVVSSNTGYVNFAAPHGAFTASGLPLASGFYRITLNKSGGGSPYYVCVNSAGLIKKTLSATCL